MKKLFLILSLLWGSSTYAQNLYHPEADAAKDIKTAIRTAKATNKFVIIQAGGNWCKWCIEFARFVKADAKIDSVMNAGFVWYHLNYSKENENKKVLASLGYPQRFGFPSLIILNGKGERIHTQNGEYLEDGKSSYNRSKVISFLEMWSPRALDPKMYGDK